MIHRSMEAPEATNNPVFLYKLHHELSGGANRRQTWWLGGNLSTPVQVTQTQWSESLTPNGRTTEARLSSDGAYVLYNWSNFGATPKIKLATVGGAGDGSSAADVISGLSSSEPMGLACWNGDANTRCVYGRTSTSGGVPYGQVRICDLDGSNDTLLYSRGGVGSGEFLFTNMTSLLVNHAGTKIGWVDISQSVGGFTNAGIYVMNIDGSSPTRIVDWSAADFRTDDRLIGFSHDDTYLAYTHTYDDGTGTKVHVKKITMGGTITDLAANINYFRQEYDYQWFPDDSGVLIIHRVYASQPRSVIEKANADGSGTAALSPEQRIDDSGFITVPQSFPVVCDQDNRIYWYDVASSSVVSVAADGSDFRTDHTLDLTGTDNNNDQQFRTLFRNG